MEEQAQQKLMAEFKKLTENLHHLLSTKQRPGVFCGPTEVREADVSCISGIHLKAVLNIVLITLPIAPMDAWYLWQMPTIDGKPVEHHILVGVRDLLRQKGYTKSGLVPNLNGTGRVPYCYMDRLSVQVRTRLFRGIGLEPHILRRMHARGMVHPFKLNLHEELGLRMGLISCLMCANVGIFELQRGEGGAAYGRPAQQTAIHGRQGFPCRTTCEGQGIYSRHQ